MRLDWAVVPVAGHGTRLYPAAAVVPKSLLPVGSWPMLHWALQECRRAQIGNIALVTGPEQALILQYLDAAREAAARGDGDDLGQLGAALRDMQVTRVVQEVPAGVGDAFYRCRDLTGEAPFAVLLPDNWFDADPAAIAQVAEAYERTGLCAFGLSEVRTAEARLFGNVGGVQLDPVGDGTHRVVALQDKLPGHFPAMEDPVLRGCARYVVDGRFYEGLAATGPPVDGEWDDVPAFQWLIRHHGLAAQEIVGRHYDVGHTRGLMAATSYLSATAAAAVSST